MKEILLVVWTDNQKCGIPVIDEQHRIIAGLMNSLFFLLSHNQFRQSIMTLSKTIIFHTQLHAFTEEYLLCQSDYPDLDEHRMLHKRCEHELAKAVKKTLESYESNAMRCDELLIYMKRYWLEHICKDDKKYIPHLKKYLGINN